ncbi:MAG: 50S ribosomal protein L3 [Candidatus ainarchaeum sp.]|nr:50S ribosomal protein L3 [Candidatus ainarchaeum sp.]
MTDIRKPRKGSMAYRPRKRARSQMPRVSWPCSNEKRLLGFAGYKAGMVQVAYVDDSSSPTKGKEVVTAATVIEVPPLHIYGIRGYKNRKIIGDVLTTDEKLLKMINVRKKKNASEIKFEECEEISVLAFINPSKTGIGKRHVEKMEIRIGGTSSSEKIEYAKGLLGKELKAGEIFKNGEYVDVLAITKGKGWQGTAKRFGTSLQRRKATGKRRHVGCLGAFHPGFVMYTTPQAGQTGYHRRTELNKRIFKIGDNVDEVNPKSGFPHYGFVKNSYMLLKGSIPGPVKRVIRMRIASRETGGKEPVLKEIISR